MTTNYPRKGLRNTEERVLTCHTVGQDYHLSIALPDNYAASGQNYPVLYLLDSDLFFGMAAMFIPTPFAAIGETELFIEPIGEVTETNGERFLLVEHSLKIA